MCGKSRKKRNPVLVQTTDHEMILAEGGMARSAGAAGLLLVGATATHRLKTSSISCSVY